MKKTHVYRIQDLGSKVSFMFTMEAESLSNEEFKQRVEYWLDNNDLLSKGSSIEPLERQFLETIQGQLRAGYRQSTMSIEKPPTKE